MDSNELATTGPATPLLVACLCAQWCGTCRDYQPLFAQVQAQYPEARFVWVDVEDHAELVDPVEVENFPTLLIARAGVPLFFGTITPHLETLRRLVQQHAHHVDSQRLQDAELAAFCARITAA